MVSKALNKAPEEMAEPDLSKAFQEHWKALQDPSDGEDAYHHWLALQCRSIPGVVAGVLVLLQGDAKEKTFTPVSRWPGEGFDASRFSGILDQVIERESGLLTDAGNHYLLAWPVVVDGRLMAVCGLETRVREEPALQAAMMKLQWGACWLEVFLRRDTARRLETDLKRLQSAVSLFASVLSEKPFPDAAMAFVNSLDAILACDRVSLGFAGKQRMEVQAVSRSATFSRRMNLVRAVEKAMDESVLQRRDILFPAGSENRLILRDHGELAKQAGSGAIITLPLYNGNQYYGAVTLERSGDKPFSPEETALVHQVCALAGPVLEDKRQQQRPLWQKVREALNAEVQKWLGPRYVGRKLALTLVLGGVVLFSLVRGEDRVTADGVLEGEIKRSVSAPFAGYIQESAVRAGDRVNADDVICTLDDRDLRLERMDRLSQISQLKRQSQEAQARHDRAEANIVNARIEQAEAQLGLVENKIERTRIRAPFDGLVVAGDLTQSLGALVQQGDVLFEITPAQRFRLMLKVDETRIADVKEGQTGVLLLPAFPGREIGFAVKRVTPVTSAEAGHNRFEVEARLTGPVERLRPGMEGKGKILVDRRRLLSIWLRPLVDKIRVWTWTWRP
jgi:RND family efflux transporter MFP subunit